MRFGKAALNSVNRKPEYVVDGKGQESATFPASLNTDSVVPLRVRNERREETVCVMDAAASLKRARCTC